MNTYRTCKCGVLVAPGNGYLREGQMVHYRCPHITHTPDALEIAALRVQLATITAAALAVVQRWETPLWKDAEPTAAVIARLRDAIGP